MISLDYKQLSRLLNVIIATSKVQSLSTPYRQIRPQMHTILYGRMGGGKSTIMNEVAVNLGIVPSIGRLTSAAILGSVDKQTGICIPPLIWESRDNCLLIDEFHIDVKDYPGRAALSDMLAVMENPNYTKRIGYRCNEFNEQDKNDKKLHCIVKDHKINCKTRFVLFLNTMMNFKGSKMFEIDALMTRCIVIPYYPSIEDMDRQLNGESAFIYRKLVPNDKNIKINKGIHGLFMGLIKEKQIPLECYKRTYGDLARTYSIVGKDKELFNLICDLALNKW